MYRLSCCNGLKIIVDILDICTFRQYRHGDAWEVHDCANGFVTKFACLEIL